MSALALKARAKINLFLAVGSRRDSGYHEIRSVMQSVTLADDLRIGPADGIALDCDRPELASPKNLVYRAAEILRHNFNITAGARIGLAKNIPVAAGLGGGSADAAAALIGLNGLWNLGLSIAELRKIGQDIGSDVPFCLTGGTALVTGLGSEIQVLPGFDPGPFIIAKPRHGLPTKSVYDEFDRSGAKIALDDAPIIEAITKRDRAALLASLVNDLEPAAVKLMPEIGPLKTAAEDAGAVKTMVTGSGSSVMIFPPDETGLEGLIEALTGRADIFVVRFADRGINEV